MATEIYLKAQDIKNSGFLETIDLAGGTFKVQSGGLSLGSGRGTVWTTLDLVSATAGTAAILAEQLNIDQYREWVDEFQRYPQFSRGVPWIYVRSDGESSEKRALVYDLTYEVVQQENVDVLLRKGAVYVRMALEHDASWQAVTPATAGTVSVSAATATFAPGVTAGGDFDMIIERCMVTTGGTATGLYQDFWLGIKPVRMAAPLNALGAIYIEPEDSTYAYGADATDGSDAACSGGGYTGIDFATTPGMAMRVRLSLSAGDDYHGRYLVLARMKIGASLVVNVELRAGQGERYAEKVLGNTIIDVADVGSTGWFLYELGEIDFNQYPPRVSSPTWSMAPQLSIYAERLAGSTYSLLIDVLYLIPSEHLVKVRGVDLSAASAGAYHFVYTAINGEQFAVVSSSNELTPTNVEAEFFNWQYPYEGGYAVFVGQGTAGHSLTGTAQIQFTTIKRFKTFAS